MNYAPGPFFQGLLKRRHEKDAAEKTGETGEKRASGTPITDLLKNGELKLASASKESQKVFGHVGLRPVPKNSSKANSDDVKVTVFNQLRHVPRRESSESHSTRRDSVIAPEKPPVSTRDSNIPPEKSPIKENGASSHNERLRARSDTSMGLETANRPPRPPVKENGTSERPERLRRRDAPPSLNDRFKTPPPPIPEQSRRRASDHSTSATTSRSVTPTDRFRRNDVVPTAKPPKSLTAGFAGLKPAANRTNNYQRSQSEQPPMEITEEELSKISQIHAFILSRMPNGPAKDKYLRSLIHFETPPPPPQRPLDGGFDSRKNSLDVKSARSRSSISSNVGFSGFSGDSEENKNRDKPARNRLYQLVSQQPKPIELPEPNSNAPTSAAFCHNVDKHWAAGAFRDEDDDQNERIFATLSLSPVCKSSTCTYA
ncbi:unnamed protein product [Caenorhabditis auriculariae]|uniref:Uncharacterized protein n=1 Tax=Caenorhabditis auriculariae TaxID=2777116 RepID=A0A8S1HXA1_9PELO|nr:unnamed protein product [Caenorhabditis auriculariae]